MKRLNRVLHIAFATVIWLSVVVFLDGCAHLESNPLSPAGNAAN